MDRPKAIENFIRITGIIKTQQPETIPQIPHLIEDLVNAVEIIQNTNKKPACSDCRARRLCSKNLAVPIITQCEVCDKEVIFMIPASHQDATHWDHPVGRISQLCPQAVRKKSFAKCPVCLKYPTRAEQIQKLREKWND